MINWNDTVRLFLRRERDEIITLCRTYRWELELEALHTYRAMQRDPQVECYLTIEHLREPSPYFFFDPGESPPVCDSWVRRYVSHDRSEVFPYNNNLLVVHRELGIPVACQLCEQQVGDDQSVLVLDVAIRDSDGAKRGEVEAWLDRLQKSESPLRGRPLTLAGNRLTFLPPSQLVRGDLALPNEVPERLERLFAPLADPGAWDASLRRPTALLLGEPGLGKTMLARWVTSHLGLTVLWLTPHTLGSTDVREIFATARELTPVVLILDDLAAGLAAGRLRRALDNLLREMDNPAANLDIGILATANDEGSLGGGLDPRSRPDRFATVVHFARPDDELRRRLVARRCQSSRSLGAATDDHVERIVALTRGWTAARVADLLDEVESRLWWTASGRGQGDVEIGDVLASLGRQPQLFGFSEDGR